ncbi:TorF family putative porin [Polaromonas sp.]|uniref:TorF family putative porin n=1 Tax=Polaromonas sp. TaxID=1869339 RepID=UPI003750B5E3
MKLKATFVAVAVSLLAAGSAFAQAAAPAPDYTLSYNVGVVSDYRFRGITQTSGKPALQGGVDFVHSSGFYLGAWGSNVKWVKEVNGATKGSYEVDLYGGFKGPIANGIGYDVGLITYQYPGNNSGVANARYPNAVAAGDYGNASTTEYYGALTYSVVTLKYSRSAGRFLGNNNSSGSTYIDLSATFDLGNGFTLTPHVGRQKIPNQNNTNAITGEVKRGNAANYTDYSLTLAKDLGNGLSASIMATDTNAKKGGFYTDLKRKFIADSQVVVGLKYVF